jgi:hypothetical protein
MTVAKNDRQGVECPQGFQGTFAGGQDAMGVALAEEFLVCRLDGDESQLLFPIDEIVRHNLLFSIKK